MTPSPIGGAALAAIARSIARLCREHGVETGNRFTVEEIATGAGLLPRIAGRYLKAHRDEIRRRLAGELAHPIELARLVTGRPRYVVVSRAAA